MTGDRTDRAVTSSDLPRFAPHELAAIKAEGYAALLVLDVGGRISIGASAEPSRYLANRRHAAGAPVRVVHHGWAPDAALARRLRGEVEKVLAGRRIAAGSELFDVPLDLAIGAVELASRRTGIKLATTADVLARTNRQRHRLKRKT